MTRTRRIIAALVLALVLVITAAGTALASGPTPVAEYSARVAGARDLVEARLGQIGDATTAHDVATQLRELFPEGETVALGSQTVTAETGTLRSLIERLDAATSADDRATVAEELLANLRSAEAALGSAGTPPAGDPAVLKRILADEGVVKSEDARRKLMDAVQKLLDRIMRWLERATGTKGAQTSFRIIYYVLLVASGLVIAWIVFVLVRRIRGTLGRAADSADAGSAEAVIAAAEGLPDDALAFADAEAAAGRYREAVRALFGAAARELVERGVVARTRTRTDGELLADVALVRADLLSPLAGLCSAFEPAWYGHVDPGADGFSAARGVYLGLMASLGGDAA